MDFKGKIIEMVEQTPNNYELGDKLRKMVWPLIFKEKEIIQDTNQISIFDEIKERKKDARSN
tara:strand:+ start:978 stop:1163 length:186 start_codon:yes stop_codon:yes gene_type:complete